jgi:hypothetical protein
MKGYWLLSYGKFIFNRDVIFYKTKSKFFDEIIHLLSCLEKKNTKGKGNLKKKPRKPYWFEKYFFFSEASSPSSGSYDINSFDNEVSLIQDSSPTKNASHDRSIEETSTEEDQQHRLKWARQLLKDVHPDERNKTRTRSFFKSQDNIALLFHASNELATFVEIVEHKECQEAMIN